MSSITKLERRFAPKTLTLRAETEGGHTYLSGYAATFDTRTNLYGFDEVIRPKAFTRALEKTPDVYFTHNHDVNLALSRTPNTLTLTQDDKGLKFRAQLPPTTFAKDLSALISAGTVRGCSFAFTVLKQRWTESKDKGNTLREILEVGQLIDVSTAVSPAYPGTSVGIRSLFFPQGAPDGCPGRVSSMIVGRAKPDAGDDDPDSENETESAELCACRCERCIEGDCDECTDDDCQDDNCTDCPGQNMRALRSLQLVREQQVRDAQAAESRRRAVEVESMDW